MTGGSGGPRLALVGAFPYPLPQGSQAYFTEQARALAAAGADVELFTYGHGAPGRDPEPDLLHHTVPARFAPRRLASGPSARKPLADAALRRVLVRRHREAPFDAVLAHNVEAAWVALSARRRTGVPVVYVAHTLMGRELSAWAPGALRAIADRAGARIDARLARRADAVLAVSREAEAVLRATARGRVAWIPPGLEPSPPPTARAVAAICREYGLTPGRFVLYLGNLDRYQDVEDLAAAAEHLDGFVVAGTHAPREAPRPLLTVHLASPQEARTLAFAAAVAVIPRRRPGGFPVKALLYMEAARPIVARAGVVDGLEDGRSVWLLDAHATPLDMAAAIRSLLEQTELAGALGRGAREVLDRDHRWPDLAKRTLELVEHARAAAAAPRSR